MADTRSNNIDGKSFPNGSSRMSAEELVEVGELVSRVLHQIGLNGKEIYCPEKYKLLADPSADVLRELLKDLEDEWD